MAIVPVLMPSRLFLSLKLLHVFLPKKNPTKNPFPPSSVFTPNFLFFIFYFFSVPFPLVFCNPPLLESTDPQPLLKLLSPFHFFHYFSPVSSSLSYPLFFQLLSILFFCFSHPASLHLLPATAMASHIFATRPCNFKHLKC